MNSLVRLFDTVRAISPVGEVRLRGEPTVEGFCHGSVLVGGVILVEVTPGPVDEVVEGLLSKMQAISNRMRLTLNPPPPGVLPGPKVPSESR